MIPTRFVYKHYFLNSAEGERFVQPDKATVRHVDEDDRTKHTVTDSLNRSQEVYIINESGLYSLILSSKLPSAKQFGIRFLICEWSGTTLGISQNMASNINVNIPLYTILCYVLSNYSISIC